MSKGGSQTVNTKQELPKWLEDASRAAIERSQQAANVGYVPYSGPSVAAFTPMQDAAFAGTNMAASAYGMPTSQGNGMPKPQTFAGGVQGYSSLPMYEQALAALKQSNPAQYEALTSMFAGGRNSSTGGNGGQPQAAPVTPTAPQTTQSSRGSSSNDDMMNRMLAATTARSDYIGPRPQTTLPGGYQNIIDMINGGGAGASGDTYQGGGLLSSAANFRANPFGIRGS